MLAFEDAWWSGVLVADYAFGPFIGESVGVGAEFANHLVNRGDRIALMAPLFTPYIEIPKLERFSSPCSPRLCGGIPLLDGRHWR